MNILDELVAKGVAGEVIVAVAKLIADAEQTQERRTKNTERMRSVRARAHTHAHTETQKPEVSKKESKSSVAKATGAHAPGDSQKADLYERGRQLLGPSAGGQITRLLACKKGSVSGARAALESAAGAGDPASYIGAVIRGKLPTTEQDQDQLVLAWCIKNGVGGCEALEIPFILEDMNGGKPYRRPARANGHNP